MDERFISLVSVLRVAAPPASTNEPAARAATSPAPAASAGVVRGVIDFAHADVVHELALMRIAAHEAFEGSVRRLLQSFGSDVLARELMLAPADIEVLAAQALATFASADPVGLAVSAADAERVRSTVPVRVDPSLGAGDLVVEVRDGAFESRFAFRLEDALARAEGTA